MCAHANQPLDCEPTKENHESIEAEAKLNVAITNIAFLQSGVDVELKLVHLAMDKKVDLYPTELDTDWTDACAYQVIHHQEDQECA